MLISPSPFSFVLSQQILCAELPVLSLYQPISLYTCSYSFCCNMTGITDDNVFAVASSLRSLGKMSASGKLSMISACLLMIELNSHADAGLISSFFCSFCIIGQCCILNHSSFSTILLSRFALHSLYFCKIPIAFFTSLSVITIICGSGVCSLSGSCCLLSASCVSIFCWFSAACISCICCSIAMFCGVIPCCCTGATFVFVLLLFAISAS